MRTTNFAMTVLLFILAFQTVYSQDTTQFIRPFITMESFNDSLAYNVQVSSDSYVQFPSAECEYVLIDVDMSYTTNFFLRIEDEHIVVNRGTAIIFRVENLNKIWCKGVTDGEVRVRYLPRVEE